MNCDLYRLARFGANLSDAHSCFIFLPAELVARLTCSPSSDDKEQGRALVLTGFHSLSTDIVADCRLPRGSGLIGWVAKHRRSIHVSPFELDSRTLGMYHNDQQLKSFIGIPIPLVPEQGQDLGAGVIACDSKKSFAFSKLQGKLLEDLAAEVANTLELLMVYSSQGQADVAWNTFVRRSEELGAALGHGSVDLLRLKLANFEVLEQRLGTAKALALADQVYRLFQQALPPHFPLVRLLNGDILVALDIMMGSFFENKFRAICEHIAPLGARPHFEFIKSSSRDKKRKIGDIQTLVALTSSSEASLGTMPLRLEKEVVNEHRRA